MKCVFSLFRLVPLYAASTREGDNLEASERFPARVQGRPRKAAAGDRHSGSRGVHTLDYVAFSGFSLHSQSRYQLEN